VSPAGRGRPPARSYLGLGSNLGDRLTNLHRAIELLAGASELRVDRCSRVYETDPVGPPQPDYLNAVAEVQTTLRPRDLLSVCLSVERQMGRERTERWGPRIIDIDLLTYDRESIDEPGLTIPHPRMHERAFVLAPLLELDADPPLPDGRRVGSTRLDPASLSGVRPFAPAPPVPVPG
jgi:2-amino-4-hydroxy-6-hydroxymethyldihydropteridine diphosphokinase